MDQKELVVNQFTRQAEIYSEMEFTRDTAGHKAIVQICGTDALHNVLDVACGPGFLTQQFARAARTVVGVDATAKFVEMATAAATRENLENVVFQLGDVNDLPMQADVFDIVACRAAFHHFSDPGNVLKEMCRVVKPGGKIAVGDLITSDDQAKAKYHHDIEVLCDPSHARALTLTEFRKIAESAGLRILNEFRSTNDYDLDTWIRHGSPEADSVQKIHALMEAAVDNDVSDLNVQKVAGKLRFTHQTVLLLMTKT